MLRRFIESHPRALAVAGALLLLGVLNALLAPWLDRASYDAAHVLWSGWQAPLTNSPVVVVYLDLDSYLAEKQNPAEPWSRALHAKLVRRLTQAGAKAVVFDIVFGAPGKDSAADQEFADALRASGRVVLAAELESASSVSEAQTGKRILKLPPPAEIFLKPAAATGLAKFEIDPDFVVRKHFAGLPDQNLVNLAWATARLLDLPVARDPASPAEPRWVRYYGNALTVPHASYRDGLDPAAVPDDFFRGKIVFVGARPMAGGFRERKDEFRSPFSSWAGSELFMPAVEVHATQMLNLARQDWLRRPSPPTENALLLFAALASTIGLLRMRPWPAAGAALIAETAIFAAAAYAFTAHHLWFSWLTISALQIPGALLASVVFHSLDWYHARRRLEAQRRQAEAKIREQAALIDKAQDAILVQDLHGRVLYANPSAARLYGWTAEELQGEGAVQQLFAPAAGKLADARRAVLEKGEWLGELEQATRRGQQLIVESRWTLIRDDAGQPKSLLLINTDVTEKKRLEAQFLRTQRMNTIGALASGMAHDLNNALSPILMGIQLIGRKAPDDETRRMLDVMESSTHRGADMVRQVLTFSRGREGERELLNVGQLVHEMENIARQTLPKNIVVSAMAPPDLWPVLGNSTQLHQVLLNLCVNARDAMPAGGELTLAADNVDLNPEEAKAIPAAAPGQYVMLLVADTGAGIAPESLPRLFEPFFTTKEPGKGTGLGLSTIARIVRTHGGFVSVKSELGSGAAFEVYLPRAGIAASPRPAAPAADLPRGNGELILLVEDDRSVREMVASSLAEQGYRVVAAANGAEALALIDHHHRDVRLVLSDLNLPATDGPLTLESIRARLPNLPVILMSGDLESASVAPGAADFLPKPFRLEDLLTAVAKALQRKPG